MYKKGLQDAMQAYEKFGEKQEKALEKIREEIRVGNKKMEDMITLFGEDLNNMYDYLTAKEKAALYNLCTPMDIATLENEEKRLLIAILYQLAEDEGIMLLNDNQRKYIRSIQKYLGVTNPQTSIDLAVVENVDSIDIQKSFLQVVLEFMYLQDNDELTDKQEDFLSYFSLNMRQAQAIELNVSKIYNTVGPEGVCEKYGFVEMESSSEGDEDETYCKPVPRSFIESVKGLFIKMYEEQRNEENCCIHVGCEDNRLLEWLNDNNALDVDEIIIGSSHWGWGHPFDNIETYREYPSGRTFELLMDYEYVIVATSKKVILLEDASILEYYDFKDCCFHLSEDGTELYLEELCVLSGAYRDLDKTIKLLDGIKRLVMEYL